MKADFYKVVTMRDVKNGDFFMFKETGRVFVRGDYDRATKTFSYSAFDDFNHEGFAKGTRKVLTGFTF